MKRGILAGVVAWLLITAMNVFAECYRVELTRVAQDLYRVGMSRTYVKTRYCYAYAFDEDAIVDTDKAEVYFTESHENCDIERIIQ